jgi:hypothetical protein
MGITLPTILIGFVSVRVGWFSLQYGLIPAWISWLWVNVFHFGQGVWRKKFPLRYVIKYDDYHTIDIL